MRKRIDLFKVFSAFLTILAFILVYLPIIIIFIMSFTGSNKLTEFTGGFSFKWYQSLFTKDYDILGIASRYSSNIGPLKEAILNTFLVSIISTIVSTILGTLFAIGIHALTGKNKRLLTIANNMPVVNPDIVTGFLLLLVFVLFQNIFGLERGTFTVLLSHIFFSVPYVVLSVLPRLKQIDQNTYEAARDLGCTRMQAIIKAIIPAIKTGIISGAMFAFTMSIDDFVITMFVSGTEFFNVSTWIDSCMRRGYIPKTIYAYNVIVFLIASLVLIFNNIRNGKGNKKEEL